MDFEEISKLCAKLSLIEDDGPIARIKRSRTRETKSNSARCDSEGVKVSCLQSGEKDSKSKGEVVEDHRVIGKIMEVEDTVVINSKVCRVDGLWRFKRRVRVWLVQIAQLVLLLLGITMIVVFVLW
ncbi:hypothetical protein ACOSQ3_021180 [Xanthoceras sorbifolium]